MPNSCMVPGCRGNYKTGPKVSVFSFPRDETLKAKWTAAIGRENYTVTHTSKICELHFKDHEILRENFFFRESGEKVVVPMERFRVKGNAVPSVFPENKQIKANTKRNAVKESSKGKRSRGQKVHFEESQYEQHRADGLRKLKPNAVPTLFVVPQPTVSLPRIESVTSCAPMIESVENNLSNSQLLPKQEPNPEPYETPPTSHVLLQNIKTEVILPDEYDTSEQQQPQQYHATASTSVPPEPMLPAPIMVWGSAENPPGVDATCHSIDQTVEKDCNEQQHQQPFKKSRVELLNSTEDRFDVFAKNVALKLREMDKTQRILVEKIINDALFEGEMGMLTRHHRLVDMSQNKDFLMNEEGV